MQPITFYHDPFPWLLPEITPSLKRHKFSGGKKVLTPWGSSHQNKCAPRIISIELFPESNQFVPAPLKIWTQFSELNPSCLICEIISNVDKSEQQCRFVVASGDWAGWPGPRKSCHRLHREGQFVGNVVYRLIGISNHEILTSVTLFSFFFFFFPGLFGSDNWGRAAPIEEVRWLSSVILIISLYVWFDIVNFFWIWYKL